MSLEHHESPRRLPPAEAFGLTYQERLLDRVSHTRLLALLDDPATTVHRIEDSYNNYGEFCFITLSRPGQQGRIFITFYGSGYHEYRERWIADEWYHYPSTTSPDLARQSISHETAKQQVEERYRTVKGYAHQDTQTRRGQVFEMLADLVDEDGAWSEMQDLPEWLLDDGEDEDNLR